MSYDFSFSKKTISFLLAGFTFVGVMLFIAGLLIGTNWTVEPVAVANVTEKQPVDAPPTPEPTVVPPEPIMSADATIRPQAALPGAADASSGASAPVKQAHGNAASVMSRRDASPLPAPPHDDDLRVVQEADQDVSDEAETTAFSVEVGLFVSEHEAHQLVRQLQKRGYTPIVLAANNNDSKLRYSVRIGAYANQTEATHAAANIAGQEKITAVVRPLGSL